MEGIKTIVLVLRSGGDFSFKDVELITRHINGKWKSSVRPRIICLWDKASEYCDLGNVEILPYVPMGTYGTWDRIRLYGPKMEEYKPFLYVDLDTAIIQSLENIFDLIKDPSQFITLEDFWQRNQLATGLVWFPKDCEKTKKVWKEWKAPSGKRMDAFIRRVCQPDMYWQRLTNTIHDFKPRRNQLLNTIPEGANLICFHGKPRIFNAQSIQWVCNYVNQAFPRRLQVDHKVSVIIPYKRDRGWLQQAIDSVPPGVQLLVSQGEGNWPSNFNKVLNQATGEYIRWLHEDDMLTSNSIKDSVNTIEEQGVDFIHGNAYEFVGDITNARPWMPKIQFPTLSDMLVKNYIHSTTLLYRREVFEKVGLMDESLNTAEEYEFNLRCLKAGLRLGYCNTFLALYRRHPQQKVRTVPKTDKDRERERVKAIYR